MLARTACGALAVLVAAPSAALAAVTAAVVPPSVRLSTQQGVVAHVILTNNGSAPVESVRLRPLAADTAGITVDVPRNRPRTIPAGGATSFVVRLAAQGPMLAERTVSILVRFRDEHGPGWASVELTATPPPELDPAKLAAVDLRTSLGSLRSGRSAPAYVLVTNRSAEPIQAGPVRVTAPKFLSASGGERSVAVAPRASERIDLDLKAADRVVSGKHQVLVEVPVRAAGEPRGITLVAGQEADIAVEGESEVLSALGVPALLLVPGALFLGVPLLLWDLRVLRHRSDPDSITLDDKRLQVAGLSIAASLGIVWLWERLGGADLFDEHGLGDILMVAGASAAAGAAVYLLPMSVRYWRQRRRTPKAGDDWIAVLRKLGRQGLRTTLVRHQVGGTNAYMLQPQDPARPATWFAPPIQLTWLAGADTALEETVAHARDITHDPKELADALAAARDNNTISLTWGSGGAGPQLVPADDIGAAAAADEILHYA